MLALPPLVLTGPPAVGKTTTGRALALTRPRCAYIDVDDLRRLVVTGGSAPWQGEEGLRQQHLGVVNACTLARAFTAAAIDVVITDVLSPATLTLYRRHLPQRRVVRLIAPLTETRSRAETRPVWLTDSEFDALHAADADDPPVADHIVDVSGFAPDEQLDAVRRLWLASGA